MVFTYLGRAERLVLMDDMSGLVWAASGRRGRDTRGAGILPTYRTPGDVMKELLGPKSETRAVETCISVPPTTLRSLNRAHLLVLSILMTLPSSI